MSTSTISAPPSALTRRAAIQNGALWLAGLGCGNAWADVTAQKPALRIGLMTDLHYGDKPEKRTRFYREALPKLDEAVAKFNQEAPAFVVELGDFIDQAPSVDEETEWLVTMESHFAPLQPPRHYVLGNHCVGTLTKEEFARHTGAKQGSFYNFDQGGVRFFVLDACFRENGEPYGRGNADWKDANIPPQELTWLKDELSKNSDPIVVFAHQRLDEKGEHSVRNAAAVRAELEKHGHILAVFQGHSHANDLQQIGGIPYITLAAMIEGSGAESNAYSMLEIMPDSSLKLQGFRKQSSREFAAVRTSAPSVTR